MDDNNTDALNQNAAAISRRLAAMQSDPDAYLRQQQQQPKAQINNTQSSGSGGPLGAIASLAPLVMGFL